MLFEGPREHSLFVWGRQERQKQGVGAQRWGESERVLASSGQVELDRFGWEGHHNKPIHVRENGQGTHSMGGLLSMFFPGNSTWGAEATRLHQGRRKTQRKSVVLYFFRA